MEKAIITFCISELFWEVARFAPYVIWKRQREYKNRKDVKFICITRPENFDIYGRNASILVPFKIKDQEKYPANGFRLDNMPELEYYSIINDFRNHFKEKYDIIEIVYPDISKGQFLNKHQFPRNKMIYNFLPRNANKEIIKKYSDEKPFVVLAPRYREGFKRNWPFWNDLYDMILENKKLKKKYNFVIVGRPPDYVPDIQKRILDINDMEQNINTSLFGLTIEAIKNSVLTVGSQSAIPNISLLLGVPSLQWGHQKYYHTVTYNIRKTNVTFLDDYDYNIDPKIIFEYMLQILL